MNLSAISASSSIEGGLSPRRTPQVPALLRLHLRFLFAILRSVEYSFAIRIQGTQALFWMGKMQEIEFSSKSSGIVYSPDVFLSHQATRRDAVKALKAASGDAEAKKLARKFLAVLSDPMVAEEQKTDALMTFGAEMYCRGRRVK